MPGTYSQGVAWWLINRRNPARKALISYSMGNFRASSEGKCRGSGGMRTRWGSLQCGICPVQRAGLLGGSTEAVSGIPSGDGRARAAIRFTPGWLMSLVLPTRAREYRPGPSSRQGADRPPAKTEGFHAGCPIMPRALRQPKTWNRPPIFWPATAYRKETHSPKTTNPRVSTCDDRQHLHCAPPWS